MKTTTLANLTRGQKHMHRYYRRTALGRLRIAREQTLESRRLYWVAAAIASLAQAEAVGS